MLRNFGMWVVISFKSFDVAWYREDDDAVDIVPFKVNATEKAAFTYWYIIFFL